MAEKTLDVRLLHAYKSESEWNSSNPILKQGEIGYVADATNRGRHKVGDGSTKWNDLPWGDKKIWDEVNGIEIGGRNLFKKCKSGARTVASSDGKSISIVNLDLGDTYFYVESYEDYEVGKYYTLSCTVSGLDSDDYTWNFSILNNDSNGVLHAKNGRCSVTFKATPDCVKTGLLIDDGAKPSSQNSIVTFTKFKLERGNKATDWTPAPEDKADVSHTHSASDISSGTLSSSILPIIPVSKGGTGLSSITSGQVLIGNGTGNITTRAIDTTNGGTSGSTSLITSGAVYAGLAGKANNHSHPYLPLSGGTMNGALNFANGTWNTVGDDVAIGDINIAGTLGIIGKNGNTSIRLVPYGASTTTGTNTPGVVWTCNDNVSSTISGILYGTFSGNLSGNASTASKWQTARTLTIGNTGKSIDGSANVSWSLAEIGAVNKTGDTISGTLTLGSYVNQSTTFTGGIKIHDLRSATINPGSFGSYNVNYYFAEATPDNTWKAIMHMTGWTAGSYASHELAFNATNDAGHGDLYHRTGINAAWQSWRKILDTGNYTGTLDARYIKKSGDTVTGPIIYGDGSHSNIILRNNSSWKGGIGWDHSGHEALSLWAKNSATRLRWHAGTDMSSMSAGTMMGITPDFEVSKASGSVVGYLAGQTILHSGNYSSYALPLSGGTMGGAAFISWPDSGNWGNSNSGVTFPVKRGGLSWCGQSDYIEMYSEETSNDNLNLVIRFGDDNSNGISIRNASNAQTAYISANGGFSGTFYGNSTTASKVLDSNNGSQISITYSKAGQSSTSWLASWNGYELGAISPANITAGKATQLATARNIFGKSFNGTADVAGQGLFYGTYTSTAGNRYYNSGLQIRENGLVGNAQSDIGYAPSIGFHWGNRIAATLNFHSDGIFYFRKQDGSSRATIDANVNGNASSATNADKVDGYHASSLWRSDGATWNSNANVTCSGTGEWSFDVTDTNSTPGAAYWHVWSGNLNQSILQCYPSNRHVFIPVHLAVGGYNNTSYSLSTNSFICNSWIRTVGSTGWYNETYGGGWYMTDSTYIRNYNSKTVRLDNLCLGVDNNSYRLYVDGTTYVTGQIKSSNSWISIAGTSSFTCPDGTAITQPGGANPMVLYAGAASARDCGIFYLSNDNAYVANSSDNAYTFGVFDTDITQNFSAEGNASLCVRSNGAGTFVRSRLGVNGINDSYNLYINGNQSITAAANKTMTLDTANSNKIGTVIGDLQIQPISVGSGSAITDGNVSSITFGCNNVAYAGIYSPTSGAYGNHLIFATTNSYANGAYGRMIITASGNVGIGTMSPSYKLHVLGDIYANGGWLRTNGARGWYNESYGGGWYMEDTDWIRTYGSKNIYQNAGILRTDGTLQVGDGGKYLNANSSGISVGVQIQKAGVSSSWIGGRSYAMIRMNSVSGYSPFASIKTTNGSWEIGNYDTSGFYNDLLFSYCTDANYNAGTNSTTAQIRLKSNGYISASGFYGNLSYSYITDKPDMLNCLRMYGGTALDSKGTTSDSNAQYKAIAISTATAGTSGFSKALTDLPKGKYSVMIRMKITANSSSGNIIKVQAGDTNALKTFYVRPNMFTATGTYQTFGFTVDHNTTSFTANLSIGTALSGVTLTIDYLAIAPAFTAISSVA